MSDARDAHAAEAHGAEAHDDFDAEPARALPAGEPRTPGWIPALGLALFVAFGVAFLVSVSDDAPEARSAAPVVTAPPASPPPRPTVPPAPGAAQRPAPGVPASALPGPGNVKRLSPEQIQELREKLKGAQQKRLGAPLEGGQERPATPPAPPAPGTAR
jgi:hypothetical protein